MKISITVYSGDPEVVWNAFRFANFSRNMNDEVSIFIMAKAVEWESMDTDIFKISEQVAEFLKNKGTVIICGTCLDIRNLKAPDTFHVATLKELHDMLEQSDRFISF